MRMMHRPDGMRVVNRVTVTGTEQPIVAVTIIFNYNAAL